MAATSSRLAYECLRCYHTSGIRFIDARYRVKEHILKAHVPERQVPFRCTLCLFRSFTWEKLQNHVTTYPPHRQTRKMRGVEDCKAMFKASTRPYKPTSRDMVALTTEESRKYWLQRKDSVGAEEVENIWQMDRLDEEESQLPLPPPVSRMSELNIPPTSSFPELYQSPDDRAALAPQISPDLPLSQANLNTPRLAAADQAHRPVQHGAAPLAEVIPSNGSVQPTRLPNRHITCKQAEVPLNTNQLKLHTGTTAATSPVVFPVTEEAPTVYKISRPTSREVPINKSSPVDTSTFFQPWVGGQENATDTSFEVPHLTGRETEVKQSEAQHSNTATLPSNSAPTSSKISAAANILPTETSTQPMDQLQQVLVSALQSAATSLMAGSGVPSATQIRKVISPTNTSTKSTLAAKDNGKSDYVEKTNKLAPAGESILHELLPNTELDYIDSKPTSPAQSSSSSSTSSSASSAAAMGNQAILERILRSVEENTKALQSQDKTMKEFARGMLGMSHAIYANIKERKEVSTQTEEPEVKRRREEWEERREEDVRQVHQRLPRYNPRENRPYHQRNSWRRN